MDGNDMNFGTPVQPTENEESTPVAEPQQIEEAAPVVEPQQIEEAAPVVEPQQIEEAAPVVEPQQIEEPVQAVEPQQTEPVYTAPEQTYTAPEQSYTAPQPDPYSAQNNYGASGQPPYGTPVQPPYGSPVQPPYGSTVPGDQPGKGEAVGSLACGIISLVFCLLGKTAIVGVILGIAGLVLASLSRKKGFEGGIRTGGFVCSLLGLIFASVVFVSCAACSACASCIGRSSFDALTDLL